MFEDVLAFAALPLAAAVVFTGIHTWFGLQVLRRNVVFADLAVAQVSALGATVAVVAGHPMQSAAAYAYTLIFTAVGALLLTASRGMARSVRQEAFWRALCVRHRRHCARCRSFSAGRRARQEDAGGRNSVGDRGRTAEVRRALQHHRHPSLALATTLTRRCRE